MLCQDAGKINQETGASGTGASGGAGLAVVVRCQALPESGDAVAVRDHDDLVVGLESGIVGGNHQASGRFSLKNRFFENREKPLGISIQG